MLPKLSERARMRCETHILRFFPAWKQSLIRETGEGREEFDEFVSACTSHLSTLRNQIAEGETPCIDQGWPMPGQPEDSEPEKEVVYVDREVIKEVENTDRLDELESRLRAAQEALERRPETNEKKVSDYRFKVPFLQAERLVNEDLEDADKRLFGEYEKLELSRPLEPKEDARWRVLQAGFFEFRG